MGKEAIRKKLIEFISYAIIFVIVLFSIEFYELHFIVPLFPILFLFDFCFLIGYPLFLRYVLKRKWFECTKDDYLCIRYIMLPLIIMELAVLLYYPHETIIAIDFLADSNFLN